MEPIQIVALVVFLVLFIMFQVLFARLFRLWVRALLSGVPVRLAALVGMSLRKVNPKVIVDCRILAVKGGVDVSTSQLETHYLAGGNVGRVVQALVAAKSANIDLDYPRATALDLAGKDVLEMVSRAIASKRPDMFRSGLGGAAERHTNVEGLVGATGTVAAPLRPVGTVLINGKLADAVENVEYLDVDTPVRVVGVEGDHVLVEPVDSPE